MKSAQHIKGHPKSKGNVIIGNDVWIGYGVTILSGVTIDDGAVIGAGSVVVSNVPPYTIVAGNPAKEIKKRFPEATIQRLIETEWWNFDVNTINSIIPLLLSDNVDYFLYYMIT